MSDVAYRIDSLQYCNWSEKIFTQMRDGGVDAVHVTIAYHENFRETVARMEEWNARFERFPHLIFQGHTGDAVRPLRVEAEQERFHAAISDSHGGRIGV